jgi:teichoic acid transport system permease protein
MSMAQKVPQAPEGLFPVGVREPARDYVASLRSRWSLIVELARSDLASRHLNTTLGQLWHLINPLLSILIYFLIFGVLLNTRRNVEDFLTFLVTGVFLFRFAQDTVTSAATCIANRKGLIRSIQFPRMVLPLSIFVRELIEMVIPVSLLVVVALADGVRPSWRWLAFPLVFAALALVALGMALIAARLGETVPDLQQLLPHLFRILFYMSGILYSARALDTNPTVQILFEINPLYDAISFARWSIKGETLHPGMFIGLGFWTLVLPAAGFFFFRRAENRYGR